MPPTTMELTATLVSGKTLSGSGTTILGGPACLLWPEVQGVSLNSFVVSLRSTAPRAVATIWLGIVLIATVHCQVGKIPKGSEWMHPVSESLGYGVMATKWSSDGLV